MKKLQIFLLLSIFLCFGFTLSTEVHAQGDGPKLFEVDDVLPATTQLKIAWYIDEYADPEDSIIKTTSNYLWIVGEIEYEDGARMFIKVNNVIIVDKYTSSGSQIIDTSSWSEAQRTVTVCSLSSNIDITWEDLNAPSGFSITFEENGGTSVTDLTEQTALPDPLPTPTKEGYTFVGWYYDSDFLIKIKHSQVIH